MKDFVLFKLGVQEEMDPELRRVTILSNMIYVVLGSIVLFYILLRTRIYLNVTELGFMSLIPVIILLTSIFCLVLNRVKLYTLSKSLFITIWILFTTVLLFAIYGSKPSDYLLHPYYCIVSSIIAQLLFSYHRERAAYIFFMFITWSLILFSVEFITYFILPSTSPSALKINLAGLRIVNFMFAAFFNFTTLYVLRLNHHFYTELQARNDTVTLQNLQLGEQHKQLEDLMVKLEEKVMTRTAVLKEQNKRLTEFAFFNSHILRAPVSRIRGLVYLLGLKIDVEEEKQVRGLLAESMNELDQAIKEINGKLEEVEPHQMDRKNT